jgi:hypothetical protein
MGLTNISPKVTASALGAGAGVGVGKLLCNVLVTFGLINPDQGASVADLIDVLAAIGMSFLGGYLRSA